MSRNFSFTNQPMQLFLAVILFFAALGATSAQEVRQEKRPLLDLEGNQIFSKKELLDIVNNQLDEWAKTYKYSTDQLDYCIHQMNSFMWSRGYLKARVTKKDVEETEAGPRLVLTAAEGPIFRVGEITVHEARLFPSQLILDTIGLRTGDIANGELLSEGLYERLKKRYAKLGYIQYTAEVEPIFHAKDGASEGVVDFKITIDEEDQFRVRSIKIAGADKALTDLLTRELMLRDGDIFDDDLFRESIKRLSGSGLIEPIDAEKDTDFVDLQEKQRQAAHRRKLWDADGGPALIDLTIHVKASTATSRER